MSERFDTKLTTRMDARVDMPLKPSIKRACKTQHGLRGWLTVALCSMLGSISISRMQQAPVDEGVVHEGLQHGHDAVLVGPQNPHHMFAREPVPSTPPPSGCYSRKRRHLVITHAHCDSASYDIYKLCPMKQLLAKSSCPFQTLQLAT